MQSQQRSVPIGRMLIAPATGVALLLPVFASTSPPVQATPPADLGTWSSMGVTINGGVYSIAWANGGLYVGGDFPQGIARWTDPPGSAPPTWETLDDGIQIGATLAIAASPRSVSGIVGSPINAVRFSQSGFYGYPNFEISPALPSGLTLNASTGEISGTPLAASPATTYTVTATHTVSGTPPLVQSAQASVAITIAAAAPAPAPSPVEPANPPVFPGGWVQSILVDTADNVFALGTFLTLDNPSPKTRVCYAAEFNGTTWSQMPSAASAALPTGLGGLVYAAGLYQDRPVAVGQFIGTGYGDDCTTEFADQTLGYIAWWDGSTWRPIGDVGEIGATPLAVAANGSQLFAGGRFNMIGNSPVAIWNGDDWLDGDGADTLENEVAALAVLGGRVFAGGALGLTGVGKGPVAAWNGIVGVGSDWSELGPSASELEFDVQALASDPEHNLIYALGAWRTGAGGYVVPANTFKRIAAWDSEISEWVAMGPLTRGGEEPNPPTIGLNQIGGATGIVTNDADVFVGCHSCDIGLSDGTSTFALAKWTWSTPSGSNNLAARTGETVTISGEGFVGVTTGGVTFGSTSVPFTRSGTSEITATVPSSLAPGTYTINVDAVGGEASVGEIVVRSGGGIPQPSPTPTASQPSASPSPTPSVAPSPSAQLPGISSMTIGGQVVQVQRDAQPRGRGVTFSAGPVTMTMRSTTPNGQGVPLAPDGSLVLSRSGEVPIEASGLAPGSVVTQTLFSAPVQLGSTVVDATGDFKAAPKIPANTPLGSHTLSIQGTTNTGDPFTFNIGVTVATPAVALGANPVLKATSIRRGNQTTLTATARGVQSRCQVTFTAGKEKARVQASTQGVARAALTLEPARSGSVTVTMRVTGKGCAPVTAVATSARPRAH